MRLNFLRFHTMAIRFYSLDDMDTPFFMGMCIYLEVKLIFRSIEHIDQPKQKPCLILVNKSLLVQEWRKPLVHTRFDLYYVSLDHVLLTMVSSVGAVWVIHAYINENSTHRSETKITDKCLKILFLIFLHYIYYTRKMY